MPAPSPTLIADAALLATLNKAMYHTGYHPSSSFQASPGAIRVKWLHSIGLVKGQDEPIPETILAGDRRWKKCLRYLRLKKAQGLLVSRRNLPINKGTPKSSLNSVFFHKDIAEHILSYFTADMLTAFRGCSKQTREEFVVWDFLHDTREVYVALRRKASSTMADIRDAVDSTEMMMSIQEPNMPKISIDLNGQIGHLLRISDVFEKLGLERSDVTEIKEYKKPPLLVMMVCGVATMLMDQHLGKLSADERMDFETTMEKCVDADEYDAKEYSKVWEVISESEGSLKQPNRWSVKEMIVGLLSASRRKDLEWAKAFLRRCELNVGGGLSFTRKLRFIGKFPLILYRMCKSILHMCEAFDEGHPEEADLMSVMARQARNSVQELVVMDRLIAVHNEFDEGEPRVEDTHKDLNEAWKNRWKKVRRKWNHLRLKEESRRRLYSM